MIIETEIESELFIDRYCTCTCRRYKITCTVDGFLSQPSYNQQQWEENITLLSVLECYYNGGSMYMELTLTLVAHTNHPQRLSSILTCMYYLIHNVHGNRYR